MPVLAWNSLLSSPIYPCTESWVFFQAQFKNQSLQWFLSSLLNIHLCMIKLLCILCVHILKLQPGGKLYHRRTLLCPNSQCFTHKEKLNKYLLVASKILFYKKILTCSLPLIYTHITGNLPMHFFNHLFCVVSLLLPFVFSPHLIMSGILNLSNKVVNKVLIWWKFVGGTEKNLVFFQIWKT